MWNIYNWIATGIVIIGFLIFIYLTFKKHNLAKKEVAKPIKEYKEIRNKLTIRQNTSSSVSDAINGLSIGNIIGGFIVILIGVNISPMVASQVVAVQESHNITGPSETILGLTTVFFALSIMGIAVSVAISGLRKGGAL